MPMVMPPCGVSQPAPTVGEQNRLAAGVIVLVQGISIPLDVSIRYLANHFSHPDHFLYVVIRTPAGVGSGGCWDALGRGASAPALLATSSMPSINSPSDSGNQTED